MSDMDGEERGARGRGYYATEPADDVQTYDATDSETQSRGPLLIIGLIVLIVAFAGVLFFAYQQGQQEVGEPPILKAEDGPTKVAPAEPGGKEFPHQDKQIYNEVEGAQDSEPPVEQLLPPAEEPMTLPSAAEEEQAADTPPVTAAPSTPVEVLPPAIEAPKMAEAPAEKSETLMAPPAADGQAASRAEPKVVAPETAPAQASPAPAATGDYVVQIAAFREQQLAEAEFRLLKKKFPDLIVQGTPDIQKADLGDKGIYYRLRVGPYASKAEADAACAALKARGQECLVRKR